MEHFELTPEQRDFCPGESFQHTSMWNQAAIFLFDRKLPTQRLREALDRMFAENDGFRLQVEITGEGLGCWIHPYEKLFFPEARFACPEEIAAYAGQVASLPFSPGEPLYRCVCCQLEDRSGYILVAHHMITDGHATGIAARQLCAFLGLDDTPVLTHSYIPHLHRQLSYPQTGRFQRDREYWLGQLASQPRQLLFSDGSPGLSSHSSQCSLCLPSTLCGDIRRFSQTHSLSISALWSSACAIYLYRTQQADRFCLGLPIANRTNVQESETAGLFMRSLPLPVSVEGGSFLNNARKIEDTQYDLYRHRFFSQQYIRQALGSSVQAAKPLFDVIVDYQPLHRLPHCDIQLVYTDQLSPALELHLFDREAEGMELLARWRTALLDRAQIDLLQRSLITILEQAVAAPHSPVATMPIYPAQCLEEALRLCAGETVRHHAFDTIFAHFDHQARCHPHRVCIRTDTGEVTFAQFAAMAAGVHRQIHAHTQGRKTVVAVMARRSMEMYAGIYGIVRSGCAYLPISPDDPEARVRLLLEDSGAALLLHQQGCLPPPTPIAQVDITGLLQALPEEPPLPIHAQGQDTAYILYTSGSTGTPKGVRISNASVVNRIQWMHHRYPLAPEDVILQKTPYTFDVSVWEILWWGMFGGQMAILCPDGHLSPEKTLLALEQHRVTHVHFVPSVFRLFLEYLEATPEKAASFRWVRHLFFSGEALTAELLQRFYRLLPDAPVQVHNLYGPTECCVDVTWYDCDQDTADPVPIGRPIHNTQAYITDRYMNLLPPGVMGELCIGGANVGQGYHGREELTAAKFPKNPFGPGRLFKTGDLAYWRADGQLIFCGRADGQIKFHGQRIELSEIEHALLAVEGIRGAAVAVIQEEDRQVLAAYYCGEAIDAARLRDRLRVTLPSYMLPAYFLRLPHMPLTSSGKTDRKALAQYSLASLRAEQARVEPPRSEAEARICAAFGSVLKLDRVGRDTNFLDAGGTSLDIMAVMAACGDLAGMDVADFIADPTPAALAARSASGKPCPLRHLQVLHTAPEARYTLLLFPYAGGNAAAFQALVQLLRTTRKDVSVVFVPWPDEEDLAPAARELASLAQTTGLYLYSHCAGAAIALRLLACLKPDEMLSVRHWLIGGNIPPAAGGKNPWPLLTDRLLGGMLKKAGLPMEQLEPNTLSLLLAQFRKDTTAYFQWMGSVDRPISCPASLLLASGDPFTRNSSRAPRRWRRYLKEQLPVHRLECDSHYFQQSHPGIIAGLLLPPDR